MSLVKLTSKESGLPVLIAPTKVVLVVATPEGSSEIVFDSGFAINLVEDADTVSSLLFG
uniref:Uncharacterized protein n=1 Tax=Pseudomonas phage Arace01 TaxID=3138526 RepID=A0AAU6VZV9_9VIRU